MTILCFLYCLLGFCSFTHQYGSNKVLVTCECLMTASIILPDTTTCCLGQGSPPPAKLLSKMKMMVVVVMVVVIGNAKIPSNIRDEDDDFDNCDQMKEHLIH